MNSSKLLTIVVPSYNAEKYLAQNLDSFLIPEVLEDIEVLIVNDGSNDGTAALAQGYVDRYPDSYRLITKENGGHGSGINTGIQYARGTYFKVVDADDWVDRKSFIHLIRILKDEMPKKSSCLPEKDSCTPDMVWSGFLWTYDEGQSDPSDFRTEAETPLPLSWAEEGRVYPFTEVADRIYIKMHNLTLKTDILRDHGIRIDEHCFYVDTELVTYPVPYIHTVAFQQEYVYRYRIGSSGQSVSIEKMQKYEKNYNTVLKSLTGWYRKLGSEIPCSREAKDYITRIIARVVAGKIKIMLSYPAIKENRKKFVEFDRKLKRHYPEIYDANINKAIMLLRKSNYLLYLPASLLVRRKYQTQ